MTTTDPDTDYDYDMDVIAAGGEDGHYSLMQREVL